MTKKSILHSVLAILLAILYLSIFHWNVLWSPNEYLFSDWGDGIKNYYTYAYHVNNDSSMVHFEGMNYPFGEVHQFTDGQPFIASSLQYLSKYFEGLPNYSIGLINALMLLSFVFGVLIMFWILKLAGLRWIFALFGGLAIMSLSPQVFRMTGHISLSYFLSFPLVWLLLLISRKRQERWPGIAIGLINIILLFIHPYLAVINIAFLLLFHLFYFMGDKWKHWKSFILKIVFQGFIPIFLWKLFLLLVDHHPDRAEDVFYLAGNTATFKSLILPPYGYFNQLLNHLFPISLPWEGWAYIGVIAVVFLLALIALFSFKAIGKRQLPSLITGLSREMKVSLLAAFILLLFSFGYPYRLGMMFLLDTFPFLQQIRSLGRFAWVFYYVFNVVILSMAYQLIRKRIKSEVMQQAIMFLIITIILIEGSFYHAKMSDELSRSPNYFLQSKAETIFSDDVFDLSVTEPKDYQAIIPIPYYHIGSPVFSYDPGESESKKWSMVLSYHSGIPLMASAMSRTSRSEAKSVISLLAMPWYKKDILSSGSFNDKDLLLLLDKKHALNEEEKYWISQGKLIKEIKDIAMYALSVNSLRDIQAFPFFKETALDNIISGQFYHKGPQNEFLCVLPIDLNKESYVGSENPQKGKMNDYNMLYDGYEYWFTSGNSYNISFWYNNKVRLAHSNTFVIAEVDENGKEDWTLVKDMKNTFTLGEEWSRMSYDFKIKENTRKLKIFLKSWSKHNQEIYFRDILIRNVETDVYGKFSDGVWFYNNHFIESDLLLE